MALIGKIRKNFWFVLIVLGLALAAFVMMDMMSANTRIGANDLMKVGEVNGVGIDYNDFQHTENTLYRNAGGDIYARRENLWNYFVEKAIVDKESEELGIGVSRDELRELEFGTNLSPIIQNNWRNQQTGQVDRAQLLQIKQQIDDGTELAPQFTQFWAQQEHQVIKTQKEQKLKNLVAKSMYVPTWMADVNYKEQNSNLDMVYVKVPYEEVSDEEIVLTDEDYNQFLDKHASQYDLKEETRTIDYVAVDVLPTAADSSKWRAEMVTKTNNFAEATDDSIFVASNNGLFQDFYFAKSDLTDMMQERIETMNAGDVSGPFIEDNNYRSFKLVNKQMVPDSVEARHILQSFTAGNITEEENAEKTIDSLMAILQSNRSMFDSLAIKHSMDPGSSSIGGDLGTFAQGRMVPAFNRICFFTGRKGGLYKVKSSVGFHIIELENRIFNDNDPKYRIAVINQAIIPTEETQNNVQSEIEEYVASYQYLEDLKAAVEADGKYSINSQSGIKINDYQLGNMPSGDVSRDIVKWAFDDKTSVNDVAPEVFAYTDPVNYFDSKYLIAGLASTQDAGRMPLEQAKQELTTLVMNEKKGELLASQIQNMNLSNVASKYNTTVDTVQNVTFYSSNIQGIGNEPMVVSSAFKTPVNSTSSAIAGNGGVYLVQPTRIFEATESNNLPQFKQLALSSDRSRVNFSLMNAVKESCEVTDYRYRFY